MKKLAATETLLAEAGVWLRKVGRTGQEVLTGR